MSRLSPLALVLLILACVDMPVAPVEDAASRFAATVTADACEDVLLSASDYFISTPDVASPKDINNAGTVVGGHGFRSRVYENFTYRFIDIPPGAHDILALAVNDAGLIGGYYYWVSAGVERWTGWILAGSSISTVEYPGSDRTGVSAISSDGAVAGTYLVTDWPRLEWKSFLSTSPGSYASIDYPGSHSTWAESVNNAHAVVGAYSVPGGIGALDHGFLYSNGSYATIQVPTSAVTWPLEINDQGVVFGRFTKTDGSAGIFTWSSSDGYEVGDPPVSSGQVEGWNDNGQIVGTLTCLPEGSPNVHAFGYLATPAQRVPIQLMGRTGSIDVQKTNPIMIAMLSTDRFTAPASASSVVLLPWEWVWGTNDLQGGTPPLRYHITDLNGDRRKDVLFAFPRAYLYNPSIAMRGVVLKGHLPSGLMFYGLLPVDMVNNTW